MDDTRDAAELDYAEHERRQREQCSAGALEAAALRLRAGGSARWTGAEWQPRAYPGFAFQAMADADERNRETIARLSAIGDALVGTVPAPGKLYPLPEDSFHQTIVNLFSAERLQKHIIEPGRMQTFPALLAEHLREAEGAASADTVRMDLIGVSLFRTALGALGVFRDARHYERIVGLRNRVYGQPALRKLGLRRTRPFIGHVTLAYIEADITSSERRALIEEVFNRNAAMECAPLPFYMPAAVLHDYQHLSAYALHPVHLRLEM